MKAVCGRLQGLLTGLLLVASSHTALATSDAVHCINDCSGHGTCAVVGDTGLSMCNCTGNSKFRFSGFDCSVVEEVDNSNVCKGWNGGRCLVARTAGLSKKSKKSGPITWHAAEENCQKLGGHLASVHSHEEFFEVKSVAQATCKSYDFYIGLHRSPVTKDQWVWTDGSSIDYAVWGSREATDAAAQGRSLVAEWHQGEDAAGSPQKWLASAEATSKLHCYVCAIGGPTDDDNQQRQQPELQTCSGHGRLSFKRDREAGECVCDDGWAGDYCAQPLCGQGQTRFHGRCIAVVQQSQEERAAHPIAQLSAARRMCARGGGYFPTANSEEETRELLWLHKLRCDGVGNENREQLLPLGFNDAQDRGVWTWESGAPVLYRPQFLHLGKGWRSYPPQVAHEDYTVASSDGGGWDIVSDAVDVSENDLSCFICEYPPQFEIDFQHRSTGKPASAIDTNAARRSLPALGGAGVRLGLDAPHKIFRHALLGLIQPVVRQESSGLLSSLHDDGVLTALRESTSSSRAQQLPAVNKAAHALALELAAASTAQSTEAAPASVIAKVVALCLPHVDSDDAAAFNLAVAHARGHQLGKASAIFHRLAKHSSENTIGSLAKTAAHTLDFLLRLGAPTKPSHASASALDAVSQLEQHSTQLSQSPDSAAGVAGAVVAQLAAAIARAATLAATSGTATTAHDDRLQQQLQLDFVKSLRALENSPSSMVRKASCALRDLFDPVTPCSPSVTAPLEVPQGRSPVEALYWWARGARLLADAPQTEVKPTAVTIGPNGQTTVPSGGWPVKLAHWTLHSSRSFGAFARGLCALLNDSLSATTAASKPALCAHYAGDARSSAPPDLFDRLTAAALAEDNEIEAARAAEGPCTEESWCSTAPSTRRQEDGSENKGCRSWIDDCPCSCSNARRAEKSAVRGPIAASVAEEAFAEFRDGLRQLQDSLPLAFGVRVPADFVAVVANVALKDLSGKAGAAAAVLKRSLGFYIDLPSPTSSLVEAVPSDGTPGAARELAEMLAEAYFDRGTFGKAVAYFDLAARLYSFCQRSYPRDMALHWAQAHLERAKSLAKDGQWPKACDECASALVVAPFNTRNRVPGAGPESDVRAQVLEAYCEAMAKRTNLKAGSHWEATRSICNAAKRTPRGRVSKIPGSGLAAVRNAEAARRREKARKAAEKVQKAREEQQAKARERARQQQQRARQQGGWGNNNRFNQQRQRQQQQQQGAHGDTGGQEPHKVLGVRPGASAKEIKKAYYKLAKKWHPDKHPGNEKKANAKMSKINAAYEMLTENS